MNGRIENEKKTLDLLDKKLLNMPDYMKGYYYSLVNKSYTTKNTYINKIICFLDFLEKEMNFDINDINCLKDVKPSTINMYLNHLDGLKNTTKANNLYAIKTLFEYLENDEYIQSNPFNKIEIPKDNEEHEIISLTKSEIKILKNNILNGSGNELAKQKQEKWVNRDYAIIMIGLSLGLRVTSLIEINVEDINFDEREIKIVEKGNKIRTISFSENIEKTIKAWLDDRYKIVNMENENSGALFISNRKTRMTDRAVRHLIEKYTKNIDKHITPHKLRSTCATNVYNKTGDIYLTADVLGHRNISNTRRYAQISKERKEKAAKAMDSILF